MRSIGEFLELLYLRLKVFIYTCKEEQLVKRLFYHDPHFKSLDKALLSSSNPYQIPQAFPYGETPLSTLKTFLDKWAITPSDHVFELGCGRGRSTFFISYYTKATVTGIDWTPSFIAHAQHLARHFPALKTHFICADMLKVDLSQATVIYLYGTCLNDASIQALTATFSQLPPSTKILTVSYPFPGLTVCDQCEVSFPWGKTGIYLAKNMAHD